MTRASVPAVHAGTVVLVLHAHPDDEVFATGAATLAAATSGASVHLRVFTGGEGRNVTGDHASLTQARARKEAMLDVAAAELGIADWGYVTRPGEWVDAPHLPDRTIAAAPQAHLAQAAARTIDELRPNLVLTVGPDGLTRHPDHVACHTAVAAGLGLAHHQPELALGAVLDATAVMRGAAEARRLFGEMVGSGAVTGQDPDPSWRRIIAPVGSEQARRRALDAYCPGLGSLPQGDLATRVESRGDSVLLRLVMDATGWEQDLFAPLPFTSRR